MDHGVNPFLLEFLDAKDETDYDRMLNALAQLARNATQKEFDDIYTVLDMAPSAGSLEDQAREIEKRILTRRKYDGERLR